MKSSLPQVSVLMPVHNAAATLEKAVGSVRAQSMADWELVIVDDGSDDQTPGLLSDLEEVDNRIHVLPLPRVGIVHALNSGLQVCRAPFVARMDADDFCRPRRLEQQAAHLASHPGTGLVGGAVHFSGDREKAKGYAAYVDWCNSLTSHEALSLNRFVESPFPHPSVMFRREMCMKHGGYREGDFPEDYDLWLRWMEAGVRVEKIRETVLDWYDPPDRLSRTDSRYSMAAFYRLKAGFLASWLERNNPHSPALYLWGAGRTTRQRAATLLEHQVALKAYVDIDPRKIGRSVHGVPVIAPTDLPPPGECFVVPYVGSRDARQQIEQWLQSRDYALGRDYIPAA